MQAAAEDTGSIAVSSYLFRDISKGTVSCRTTSSFVPETKDNLQNVIK
jgi:hypothetical protein